MTAGKEEEEDWDGDIDRILRRRGAEIGGEIGEEIGDREEQPDTEEERHDGGGQGDEGEGQGGEDAEDQPLHIVVEVSTDESEYQGGEELQYQGEEELQAEGEAEDQEVEEMRGGEESPTTPRTTRAGRKVRKPNRYGEEVQGQLSPKERSRRKSRVKFKKFREEN